MGFERLLKPLSQALEMGPSTLPLLVLVPIFCDLLEESMPGLMEVKESKKSSVVGEADSRGWGPGPGQGQDPGKGQSLVGGRSKVGWDMSNPLG